MLWLSLPGNTYGKIMGVYGTSAKTPFVLTPFGSRWFLASLRAPRPDVFAACREFITIIVIIMIILNKYIYIHIITIYHYYYHHYYHHYYYYHYYHGRLGGLGLAREPLGRLEGYTILYYTILSFFNFLLLLFLFFFLTIL